MSEREPQFIESTPKSEKNENEISEKQQEQVEKKDRIRELKDDMKKIWEELRKEGIPINEKARINMDEFRKTHGDKSVESDKAYVENLKKIFKEADIGRDPLAWARSREEISKKTSMGEIFEMLKTSIFHKKLGKDFIVVRTSEYDDFRNKVDNIILERETGNIVCAFDEVEFFSKKTSQKKEDKVLDKNEKGGGADLKYGIFLEKKDGKMKLKKGPINQIPLFYLAMTQGDVIKALNNPDQREQVFYKLVDSIKEQIKGLEGKQLHSKLKERLDHFEKVIERF